MDAPFEKENLPPSVSCPHNHSFNKPNPQYYRDHTYHKHRWMVLSEPDPDVEWELSDNSDSSDDLLPAYSKAIKASKSGTALKPVQDWTTSAETLSSRGHSPAHGSKPASELSSSTEDHQSTRDPTTVPHTHINFQVPDADSSAGASGHNLAHTIQISSTASFQDGKDQICLAMRIHPANEKLGYRWDNSKKHEPTEPLTSDVWERVLKDACDKQRRARSHTVFVIIVDLNLPVPDSKATKKRKRNDDECQVKNKRQSDINCNFQLLDQQLKCQLHAGTWCWADHHGQHHHLTDYHLTLWATEILHGASHATLDHLPNNIVFQDLFYNNKKPRQSYHQDISQASPQVHVHNHFAGIEPNSRVFAQRNDVVHAGTSNTPIILDDASTPTLHIPSTSSSSIAPSHPNIYPTLGSILQSIDAEGSFESLGYPVEIFTNSLAEYGFVTVDQLVNADMDVVPSFLTFTIGMVEPLCDRFLELADSMKKNAKGKWKVLN